MEDGKGEKSPATLEKVIRLMDDLARLHWKFDSQNFHPSNSEISEPHIHQIFKPIALKSASVHYMFCSLKIHLI